MTKISPFIANYGRELRIGIYIKRKDRESNRVCRKNEERFRKKQE